MSDEYSYFAPPDGEPLDGAEGLDPAPSAAMGLSEVVRWTRQHPFIDVFKTSIPWIGNTSNKWQAMRFDEMKAGGFVDENGWVKEIPPGISQVSVTLLSDLPPENTSLAGRYHLRYEGSGSLEVSGRGGLVDVVSRKPNEIIFDFTPGEGRVIVSIKRTDTSQTGDYVRNITVVKEEYLDLHESGAVFNPVWIDLIDDLRSVRFMDWMRINDSEQRDWTDRPMTEDATYATGAGVPLEVMVDLANQIGADPWFNIPFHATDDYVRNFASHVRDKLDPELKARFEFSNEVWNNTFDQTDDAHEAGRQLWGDSFGNYPGRNYYGYRSAQVLDIVKDEYGAEAEARVEGVLGVHTATPRRFERIVQGVEAYGEETGATMDGLFDSVAVTWYFGGGFRQAYDDIKGWMAQSNDTAIDNIFTQLKTGSLLDYGYTTAADTIANFPAWARIAEQHGLDLISYEGGTHIVGNRQARKDEEFVDLLTQVNRDPRMAEIYDEIHTAWIDAGGGLFNAFQDIKRDGRSGSWGHLTHLDDQDARWDAVMAFNQTPNPNLPPRKASDYDHGVTLLGTDENNTLSGTLEEDFLIGRGGNDVLRGGDKNDGLHGGDGNDWLDGGDGMDTVLGGPGDDTIVFDAKGDHRIDGGDGTDTLLILGGALPRLDLSEHNLERAAHVVTDDGSEDWTKYADLYDRNWVRTAQEGVFDDGRTWRTEFDAANRHDWSSRTEIFDADGKLLERIEKPDAPDQRGNIIVPGPHGDPLQKTDLALVPFNGALDALAGLTAFDTVVFADDFDDGFSLDTEAQSFTTHNPDWLSEIDIDQIFARAEWAYALDEDGDFSHLIFIDDTVL